MKLALPTGARAYVSNPPMLIIGSSRDPWPLHAYAVTYLQDSFGGVTGQPIALVGFILKDGNDWLYGYYGSFYGVPFTRPAGPLGETGERFNYGVRPQFGTKGTFAQTFAWRDMQ